jgi:hypothetical protein
MTTSFCYVVPDGNSVELQCDNFGDRQKFQARKAGASVEEIHERASVGSRTTTLAVRDGQLCHRREYAGDRLL